jgi:sarcosine oxidase subunit gamma
MASTSIDGIRLESPLIARSDVIEASGVSVRERPFRGHVNVRGRGDDSAFRGAVENVAGVALPLEPNTVNVAGERVLLWLGPTEWLLTSPGAEEMSLSRALEGRLTGEFASVVRIGGGQTVLELEGDGARDLLAKGCPLDLHPRAFPVGRCAQTHVEKAPALLRPLPTGIELIVRRSFADYLRQWLETVARQG